MVNYVLTKVYSLLTSFLRLAKFLVLWSTIYLAEIKLCEFALFIYLFIYTFIYSVFEIKTSIPYFGHHQCCRRRSDSVLTI